MWKVGRCDGGKTVWFAWCVDVDACKEAIRCHQRLDYDSGEVHEYVYERCTTDCVGDTTSHPRPITSQD